MTDLKPGDRVRVEYEGVVDAIDATRILVEVHGRTYYAATFPEHCTMIAPLVKVGDVVDYDALEALPPGAVVRDNDGDIGVKDRDWSVSGFRNHHPPTFFNQPVTLLWLPE